MKALLFNNNEAISLLLRYGANTEIKNKVLHYLNKNDQTAIMIATSENNNKALNLLEKYKSIFLKLCMLFYSKNKNFDTIFRKFTPEMMQKLKNYIII